MPGDVQHDAARRLSTEKEFVSKGVDEGQVCDRPAECRKTGEDVRNLHNSQAGGGRCKAAHCTDQQAWPPLLTASLNVPVLYKESPA